MSSWTYISGSIQLSKSSCEEVRDENNNIMRDADGYCLFALPYPKEQIKLNKKLDNTVNVYSYPIIKRIVDREIDAMPCAIDYWLNPVETAYSNGSLKEDDPDDKSIIDVARDLIGDSEHIFNRKDTILSSILNINSPVRDCDAEEMYGIMVQFIKNLVANDIVIGRGVLTWKSSWGSTRYTFYFGQPSCRTYCEIYDIEADTLKTDEYNYNSNEEVDRPYFEFNLYRSHTGVLQCKKEN